jgi:hypothetical protein
MGHLTQTSPGRPVGWPIGARSSGAGATRSRGGMYGDLAQFGP